METPQKKTVAVVLGTRPEAIKLAPLIRTLRARPDAFRVVVISTGQHKEMLQQVVKLFEIELDVNLELMKPQQPLEHTAAEALKQLPHVYEEHAVDLVIVQGDTTTAFIAALAAYYRKLPLAHVEAGLRTNRKFQPFPEEGNRRLISHLADFNFAPTQTSRDALLRESVPREQIFLTGNTGIDALFYALKQDQGVTDAKLQAVIDRKERIVLVTAHRRESFGKPLEHICSAIQSLLESHQDIHFVFPVHLNPEVQNTVRSRLGSSPRVQLLEPLDYRNFVQLMKQSYLILTDSGGVQEEAPSLGKPVLVLREASERPEAISAGTVELVGTSAEQIEYSTSELLNDSKKYQQMAQALNPYGDGKAAERIRDVLLHSFGFTDGLPEEFGAD